jgi:hypothetical protein
MSLIVLILPNTKKQVLELLGKDMVLYFFKLYKHTYEII